VSEAIEVASKQPLLTGADNTGNTITVEGPKPLRVPREPFASGREAGWCVGRSAHVADNGLLGDAVGPADPDRL
jgi:hypothetical protein